MKIFQTIENNFALMGITADQSTHKYPFNARNLLVLLTLLTTLFSDVMYLIYDTNDFKEYTISVFSASTMTVAICIFCIILFRMRRIFDYLNHIEGIINNSK